MDTITGINQPQNYILESHMNDQNWTRLAAYKIENNVEPYLIRTTDVLSRSSLGWNCTGILTVERGLRTVTIVPGAGVILLPNMDDNKLEESL